ncbi:hypothetical protein D1007_49748 [Hordeum vulgare]|nr:hypothetical protein D1007_49748 [Hordeum vulgare]
MPPSVRTVSIPFADLKKCKEDDRISKLPNDIPVNILDRLDFRDVTRTSVLSTRWSQLPANLSRLQISACDFLSPQTSISDDELDRNLVRINALRRINAVNAANAAVVKATKSILAHRDPGGCTIRLLSTTFYLRGDTPISVGHTVGNAMATLKVEKAEFTVLTEKEECKIDDLVNYGTRMVKLSTFLHETFVGDLTLGFKCEKIWVQPECLTRRQAYVFQQLRFLNLVKIPEGYDLTWTMFFLEAAPSLEELYMMVVDHKCEMEMNQEIGENKGVEWESPTPNFKHHCLAKFILLALRLKTTWKCLDELQPECLHDAWVRFKCPGANLPIKFPYTDEDQRAVRKRLPRGIGSLAKIHFFRSVEIRAEHQPRID